MQNMAIVEFEMFKERARRWQTRVCVLNYSEPLQCIYYRALYDIDTMYPFLVASNRTQKIW